MARVIEPDVAAGDAADAVELGTQELRRLLGDPSAAPSVDVIPPAPKSSPGRSHAWAALAFVLGVAALLLGGRFVTRRRRSWGIGAPVLWGSGWGRDLADPLASLHRRHRRVRDALHAAEAETGLLLCFWLGPTDDAAARADELFAGAAREGHAAALLLVASDRPAIELRVADWAATRLTGELVADLAGRARVDVLVTAAERIAASGGPAPSHGGVAAPELH